MMLVPLIGRAGVIVGVNQYSVVLSKTLVVGLNHLFGVILSLIDISKVLTDDVISVRVPAIELTIKASCGVDVAPVGVQWFPVVVQIAVSVIMGAVVSKIIVNEDGVLGLAPTSITTPAGISTETDRSGADGVTVKSYILPGLVAVKLPIVTSPFVTPTSDAVNPVIVSENVTVIGIGDMLVGLVAVEVMVADGGIASFNTVIGVDHGPILLAASVALASTDTLPSAKVLASIVMLKSPVVGSAGPVLLMTMGVGVVLSVNLISTVDPASAFPVTITA